MIPVRDKLCCSTFLGSKNDVHQPIKPQWKQVNKAGNELLESSAGDDASSLRNRLETMNQCWESVLQKTEEREQQLQSTLQQVIHTLHPR